MFSTWLHFTLHFEFRLKDFRFAKPSRGVNSTLIDSIFMFWKKSMVPISVNLNDESNPYMKSHFWKGINAFSTLCAEKCFKVGIKFIVDKDNTDKQIDKNMSNTVLLKSFPSLLYCSNQKHWAQKGSEIVRMPEHSELITVWPHKQAIWYLYFIKIVSVHIRGIFMCR